MKFPHALNGVLKYYQAMILEIVALVAGLLTGVSYLAFENQSYGPIVGIVGIVLFAILSIVSLIFQLKGTKEASIEEHTFKIAFIIIIASIIVQVLSGIFSSNQIANKIFEIVNNILEIVVLAFVVMGIVKMANRLGHKEMSARGDKMLKLFLITSLVLVIINIVTGFFITEGVIYTIISVIELIGLIFNIVLHINYLYYLRDASEMLQK